VPTDRRQRSCRNSTYHDPDIDLTFAIFCDLAFGDGFDLPNGHSEEENIADCLQRCASYTGTNGGCWGVSFSSPSTCILKGEGISLNSSNLRRQEIESSIGLISPLSQMDPPLSQQQACPVANGTVLEDPDTGMKFEIICNSDINTPDYHYWDETTSNEHVSSLEDCVAYCGRHDAPQCQSIVFDPGMSAGFVNCYPKSETLQNVSSVLVPVPEGKSPRHVAVAKLPEVNASCTDGKILRYLDDKYFKLSCDVVIDFEDVADPFHADSIDECFKSCVDFVGPWDGARCLAISWDALLQGKYDNCYRKSALGNPKTLKGAITAQLTTTPAPQNSSVRPSHRKSTKLNGSGEGRAWIAGVVIGILIVLAITAGLIWFYRRKRKVATSCKAHDQSRDLRPAELPISAPSYLRNGLNYEAFQRPVYTDPLEAYGQGMIQMMLRKRQ
jgi:hypothetical protein